MRRRVFKSKSRALTRSRKGAAAIEAALLFALFLAPISAIVIESWARLSAYERTEDALNAIILQVGHQTALANDAGTLNPLVEKTAGKDVSWTFRQACFCVPELIKDQENAKEKSCKAACSDGLQPARFGIYTTKISYTPIVPVPGYGPTDITSTGRVRLE